jgi:hypothetical protein
LYRKQNITLYQYGFKSHSSTENATFKLLNEIYLAFNNRETVGGIFWNLQKAFNCVNHDILLSKLRFYGIKGRFFNLLSSHLQNRYQKVELNNKNSMTIISSDWNIAPYGIPKAPFWGHCFFLYKWFGFSITKTCNPGTFCWWHKYYYKGQK